MRISQIGSNLPDPTDTASSSNDTSTSDDDTSSTGISTGLDDYQPTLGSSTTDTSSDEDSGSKDDSSSLSGISNVDMGSGPDPESDIEDTSSDDDSGSKGDSSSADIGIFDPPGRTDDDTSSSRISTGLDDYQPTLGSGSDDDDDTSSSDGGVIASDDRVTPDDLDSEVETDGSKLPGIVGGVADDHDSPIYGAESPDIDEFLEWLSQFQQGSSGSKPLLAAGAFVFVFALVGVMR